MSRPTLTILVPDDGSCVKSTRPRIENTSKTDAEGTVILRLLIDGVAHHCDDAGIGAYSGHRIWYFPATNKEMRGNINLMKRIREILGDSVNLRDKEILLESCMHYRRFYPYRHPLLKWRRIYRKMYRSPIQRWRFENCRWVLVPDFLCPQKPYDYDRDLLRREPESKIVKG
ncbi:MAG: hypothetical protein KKG33_13125 [candidate division Zixibacteria bacterium]|nr:hypothetical protein [candidate division Zixibacteria bacterium]MBU2626496.1 hypothetical protein [candidate division Zixibacteria bacterium]